MATQTLRNKTFVYPAIVYRQRDAKEAPQFILFHAPASAIIKWADVERLSPTNTSGAQRPLRDLRVKKVAKFFTAETYNTIPTAVIIALDQKSVTFTPEKLKEGGIGKVRLCFTGAKKPGLIIDGQHRVHGAALFDPDIHLNVVAFLGDNDAERAFQFVVINNTGLKVSRDHIKALNLSYDPGKLNDRLVGSAGVALGLSDSDFDDLQVINGSEPFGGKLDLPINKNGFIAANAVESALQRVRDNVRTLGIEGLERDIFLEMWSIVKAHYVEAWKPPSENQNLLKKVSLYALTEFLLEEMRGRSRAEKLDYTKTGVLKAVVLGMLRSIPIDFWQSVWKAKELDTSAGRQILVDTLTSIESNTRYERHWADGIKMVDAALTSKAKKKTAATSKKVVAPKKRRAVSA